MYYLNRGESSLNQTPSEHPFLSQCEVAVGQNVTVTYIYWTTAAYIKPDDLKYQYYDGSAMLAQHFPEREQPKPSEILFDLLADASETTNVIDEH